MIITKEGVASLLVLLLAIFIMPSILNAQSSDKVTVEADIILMPTNATTNESIVGIRITPDYVDLGEVIVGGISNVSNVSVTNTGSIKPVKITAELINSSDDIFEMIQLKDTSSSWKNLVNFTTNLSSTK